ncbi:soluble lamin-associated protein of 75 kDa-like [Chelonus insularis]|uniref:soluble lamin-associated protein of 75 kDa-like n=1 Tax=Chelonus insularis TaxID=460826 RepID=UPI00158BCA19|nr:soluble lamin-associated protein of 75 kDa-like [Chelonus insularis]
MFCKRCNQFQSIYLQQLNIKLIDNIKNVQRINCKICKTFIGVTEKHIIINIDTTVNTYNENGWKKANSDRDKIVYYILSQIIYPEMDHPVKDKFESIYDCADETDDIYLRWKQGIPVGFYTVKRKGTKIFNTPYAYSMNTLDTAYIRSKFRNKGLGLEILYNVIENYPNDDIGFSKPISEGMLRLLHKFLSKHKEFRLSFWEIENGGIEGSAKLIWFNLKKSGKN